MSTAPGQAPHAYVPSAADYTNTCQKCGRPKGSYLHQQDRNGWTERAAEILTEGHP